MVDRGELEAGLSSEGRQILGALLEGKPRIRKEFYQTVGERLDPDLLPPFDEMVRRPGFQAFLRRRGRGSGSRFADLLEALLRQIGRRADPALVAEQARGMGDEAFRAVERSFFFVPVDREGCRLFEQGYLMISAQDRNLLEVYYEYCTSEEFYQVRRDIRKDGCLFESFFLGIVDIILGRGDAKRVCWMSWFFIRPEILALYREAEEEGRGEAFLRDLLWLLAAAEEPETAGDMILRMAGRIGKNRAAPLARYYLWRPYWESASEEDLPVYRAFIRLYGNPRKEMEAFITDSLLVLPLPYLRKGLTFFTSDAFLSVMHRHEAAPEVLKLLIQNILVVLRETEMEELPASIFPLILKVLLRLKMERSFLLRRGKFYQWLKGETGSLRIEMVLVKIILFEYIFLAAGVVEEAVPQRMTHYFSETHQQFCRLLDGVMDDPVRRREIPEEILYRRILKGLRQEVWAPIDQRFRGMEDFVRELSLAAISVQREDAMLRALEETEPAHLTAYYEAFMDTFRRNPDFLDEAIQADYWYRVPFSRAASRLRGLIFPLVGTMPLEPSREGQPDACTDNKTIILPAYVNDFQDPLDPLEENRNLAIYAGLALHEAAHVACGTFAVDFVPYMVRLEEPLLFKTIFNFFEDYRIEKFLILVQAHPQGEDLLSRLNEYQTSRMNPERIPDVSYFLNYCFDQAGGYNLQLRRYPEYRAALERLFSRPYNPGRFPSLEAMAEYGVERLVHLDVRDVQSAFRLSEEFYQVMKHWPRESFQPPDEETSLIKGRQNLPEKGRTAGARRQPLTREELDELYRQYNANPRAFLEDLDLPALAQLVPPRKGEGGTPAGSAAPGAASGGEGGQTGGQTGAQDGQGAQASGQAAQSGGQNGVLTRLQEQQTAALLEGAVGFDYTQEGQADQSTRTAVDDASAGHQQDETYQERLEALNRLFSAPPRQRKGKKETIYQIDPVTRSRTRLCEVQEFPVRRENAAYLEQFRRWEYLSRKIYQQFAEILQRQRPEEEFSSLEGDVDVPRLVEVLSDAGRASQTDFLTVIREEERSTLEVVVGMDISGSTLMTLDEEEGYTVLDIEKAFALIFGKAMETLADRITYYAFNSMSSTNVYRALTRRAVSSFQADNANRDGDFIRFVKKRLEASSRDLRYFFLISDGQPSSVNYEGKEALDDTVVALRETSKAGIKVVYLNVDTAESDYFDLFRRECAFAEHFSRPEDLLPQIPKLLQSVVQAVY